MIAIPAAAVGVFAIGDWIAVARRSRRLEYLCKPAATAALIALALVLDTPLPGRRTWFVVALVFSLGGDVLLMLPRNLFVAGLASFLVAHLAYIAGLGLRSPVLVPVVVAAALPVAVPVLRAVSRELRLPVAAYMVAITVMVAAAIGSRSALAGAGAVLFYLSDATIAWNRFVRPVRGAQLAIMVTYHLAQTALVLSLA